MVRKRLRQSGLAASPHLKCHWYLDVVPLRASRAEAIRYLTLRWGLSLEKVLVVASQQGDDELIRGLITSIIPFDHDSSSRKNYEHDCSRMTTISLPHLVKALRTFKAFETPSVYSSRNL